MSMPDDFDRVVFELASRAPAHNDRAVEGMIPEPTTWAPVDLAPVVLRDATVDPPSVLARSDGVYLLYPSRVHAFQGEPESLKSWAAQLAAMQVISWGDDVLYIDFEDTEVGVVSRLRAMGLAAGSIASHLVYIRPDEPLRMRHNALTPAGVEFENLLARRSFALCVIDGVTEAMAIEGLDLLSNADVATWIRRLPRPIAEKGAAVVVLDHVPKDRTNQGRYAIGAQHKLATLTGAAYKFSVKSPLARATGTTPVEARVIMTVEKDRPGFVRARAIDGKIAELRITSWPEGNVSASLEPPTEGPDADSEVAYRILEFLAHYDGSPKNGVEHGVEGNATAIRNALRWAVDQRWVRVEQKGNRHLLHLTDLGRAQLGGTGDER